MSEPRTEAGRALIERLIHSQYLAGRDSPNHSPESRRAWRRLYERDITNAGGTPVPDSEGREPDATPQETP